MQYVFVSYLREDHRDVDLICEFLRQHGISVWLDRDQIRPGSRWRAAIREAISSGAFFAACFSKAYNDRERAYMNEELTLAIEELRLRPTNRSWFIPILLPGGTVPDRQIGSGETLRDLQWIELEGDDSTGLSWDYWADDDELPASARSGLRRLAHLIRERAKSHTDLDYYFTEIRLAVVDHSEERLRGQLEAMASQTIAAILDQFIEDKDLEEHGYWLRPVCEILGNRFTRKQVIQLATRGRKEASKSGFIGLTELYDHHFEHMVTLDLPGAFSAYPDIYYYCRLREKYPYKALDHVMRRASKSGDYRVLEIEGWSLDLEYFSDKELSRGRTALLDAMFTPSPSKGIVYYLWRRIRSFVRRVSCD